MSTKLPNGRIALIQTVTRSLVALGVIGSSVYLLANGITVPTPFWVVVGSAIIGIYGAESFTVVLDYFAKKGK